jgi:hypothetical protein
MDHHFPKCALLCASHPTILINVLPNITIKSHTIITMNAAPHFYLSRSFALGISFVADAWAEGALDSFGSAIPADEFFAVTGVSFFTEGCAAAALGSSSVFLDGTSGFAHLMYCHDPAGAASRAKLSNLRVLYE